MDEKEKKVVERYRENLEGIDGIQFNPIQKNVKTNYAYFPIVIDEKKFGHTRNDVYDELAKNNIFSRKYFYPLTNAFDCYKGMFDVDQTPVALGVSKRVLTLPLYADLSMNNVDRISDMICRMKQNT